MTAIRTPILTLRRRRKTTHPAPHNIPRSEEKQSQFTLLIEEDAPAGHAIMGGTLGEDEWLKHNSSVVLERALEHQASEPLAPEGTFEASEDQELAVSAANLLLELARGRPRSPRIPRGGPGGRRGRGSRGGRG